MQVRNSVDMYPDFDPDVDPQGSFPPLVSRLYCGQVSQLFFHMDIRNVFV